MAHLNALAEYEMKKIEDWLESHGIDASYSAMDGGGLRDGSGCSLEELEYGNDITDELCERIERELVEK